MSPMDEDDVRRHITEALAGVEVLVGSEEAGTPEIAWGDTFFFYDPDHIGEEARRFPFATIVTKDYGDFDNASNLDRPGVYRLNVGVGRETLARLLGDAKEHDFSALDRLMPHPVYGENMTTLQDRPTHTSLYWTYQTAPGRTAGTAETKDVDLGGTS
jgi:hypothetical protein